jgi:hypothetical protein
MKKLTNELFDKYVSDPLKYDEEVRSYTNVSDSKYYTVSTWPLDRAGYVDVISKSVRVVKTKKISKSDQK